RSAGQHRSGVALVALLALAREGARVAHRGRRRRGRRAPTGCAPPRHGEGGEVGVPHPARLPSGTTGTVQELYFNTPARRKFLRTDATEYGHCEEAFRRIALSHPDTGFTMQHNASVRYRLLAQGRRARVDALLGDQFAAQAAYVDEHGP